MPGTLVYIVKTIVATSEVAIVVFTLYSNVPRILCLSPWVRILDSRRRLYLDKRNSNDKWNLNGPLLFALLAKVEGLWDAGNWSQVPMFITFPITFGSRISDLLDQMDSYQGME